MRAWQEATDTSLSLDGSEGQECYLGLDLATRTDLAAKVLVFPSRDLDTGRTTYAAFACCYLERGRGRRGAEPVLSRLGGRWPSGGNAGNETDFGEIESDVRQLCSRFNVVSAVMIRGSPRRCRNGCE